MTQVFPGLCLGPALPQAFRLSNRSSTRCDTDLPSFQIPDHTKTIHPSLNRTVASIADSKRQAKSTSFRPGFFCNASSMMK